MALTKISGSILKDPLNLGEVSIGGTLTYQDVTNVDSVGIITARSTIDAQGDISIADKIIHTGDTNTAIRFPAVDTISFETSGSERLRIDSGGRVLIGTTTEGFAEADDLTINSADHGGVTIRTPTNKEGNIAFSDTTSGTGEYSGLIRYRHSQNDLGLWTNSNLRLLIASTGQVLIGTTTPSGYSNRLLTVAAADGDSSIELRTATDHAGQISFTDGSAGDATNYRGYIQYDHNGDYMRFGTSSTERIRIDSIGRLLINRTSTYASSSERLSVNGMTSMQGSSTTTPPLYIFNTDTTGSGTVQPFFYLHDGSGIRGGLGLQYSTGNFIINGQSAIQLRTGATGIGGSEKVRIDSSGKIGINQTSPQALVHIGNYETIQNVQQSTVTQYFIDSTKSLKIARQSAGNVTTNAAWYTVATLALGGFSYRCQVSLGGNFTQDVVDIDIQTAYSTSLNNKYSFQMTGKAACAHNNNRITRARVTTAGLLQVWINNGVDSNTTAKVVLETTCGIYAQNAADNAYPMPIVVDSSSPSIITHHLLNFGVHAQWTWTINSSSVRSYTRLSGEEFCGVVNAGNGSNQGVNNTFNAPMDGLYHCDFSVAAISSTGNNNCLISFYGSMTYDAQNNIQNNQEVYDPRGCGAATQPQQGSGFSTVFKMAKGDYFTFDFYRPGGGNGYTDGGGQIFDIAVHKIQ